MVLTPGILRRPIVVGTSIFPLVIDPTNHALLTATGLPFLIHGDAAWSLMVQPLDAEVTTYLNDRATRGVNAIIVSVIEHKFTDNAPNNIYGVAPFTTPNDFSTPNETYFARVAAIIAQAATKNILMLLNPALLGVGGGSPTEGWETVMQANGQTKLTGYGTYLANRLAAYDNILWVHGTDSDNVTLSGYIAAAIKAAQPKWFHTFQGTHENAGRAYSSGQSWFNINDIYAYSGWIGLFNTEYPAAPTRPVFFVESHYENEFGTPQSIRQQAYEGMLAGGCGHVYGNNPIWFFGAGWATHLNDPAAASLVYLKTLFDSL